MFVKLRADADADAGATPIMLRDEIVERLVPA